MATSMASLAQMISQLTTSPGLAGGIQQGREMRRAEEEQALKRRALEFDLEQAEALAPYELLKAKREAIMGPQATPTAMQKNFEFLKQQGMDHSAALGLVTGDYTMVQTDQGPQLFSKSRNAYVSPSEAAQVQQGASAIGSTIPARETPTGEAPAADPTTPKTALQLEQERRAEEKANRPGQPGYVIALNPDTEDPITYTKPINISEAENKEIRETITTHYTNQRALHGLMDQIHENPVGVLDPITPKGRENAKIAAGRVKQLYFAVKDLEEMGALTDADIAMLSDLIPDPTKIEDRVYEWAKEGTLIERLKQFEEFLAKGVKTTKKAYGIQGYEPKPWEPPSKEDEEGQQQEDRIPLPPDPNEAWQGLVERNPNKPKDKLLEAAKAQGILPPDFEPQVESPYQAQRSNRGRGQRGGAVASAPNATTTPEASPEQQNPVQQGIELLRGELNKGASKQAVLNTLNEMKAEGIINQSQYRQIVKELQLGTYSEPLATERLRGGSAR